MKVGLRRSQHIAICCNVYELSTYTTTNYGWRNAKVEEEDEDEPMEDVEESGSSQRTSSAVPTQETGATTHFSQDDDAGDFAIPFDCCCKSFSVSTISRKAPRIADDETGNRLQPVYQVTKKQWMGKTAKVDDNMAQHGRVMEMVSNSSNSFSGETTALTCLL